MTSNPNNKKRVVVSYKNLSAELLDEVKKKYPHGWTDHMIRIDKSPTDFFYAIMLETEETSYLIKVDVKVDASPGQIDDEDKEYYDDEIKGADEIADSEGDSDDSSDD